LAFSFEPPACLRIYDSVYDANFPFLIPELDQAIALSHPQALISAQGNAELPGHIFTLKGQENTWCYYFQKADLARQEGDWEQVAELGDTAFSLDDSPNHATERLPFIEAYAHVGRWGDAFQLTLDTFKINPYTRSMLCDLWGRVEQDAVEIPSEGIAVINTLNPVLSCKSN
jgi:hypothetical protein